MAAPVAAKAAVAVGNSKAGRRLLGSMLLLAGGLSCAVVAPLAAPPVMVLAVATAANTETQPTGPVDDAPTVVGEWGLPLTKPYSHGRGFGFFPVLGCPMCKSDHNGADISKPCGAPVHAAAGGTVTRAGSYFDYGNAVFIDHGNGIETAYGHLQWGSERFSAGDSVDVGEVIGTEGTTGVSTGCHLHFEVWVHGTRTDPKAFLAGLGLEL